MVSVLIVSVKVFKTGESTYTEPSTTTQILMSSIPANMSNNFFEYYQYSHTILLITDGSQISFSFF